MAYRVELRPAADRQLRALPREVQEHIRPAIDALQYNPRPIGVKKLQGERDFYRIRAGPGKAYRVIYQITDEVLVVLVVKIGHRRDVYR